MFAVFFLVALGEASRKWRIASGVNGKTYGSHEDSQPWPTRDPF
jgi:hypothetical protein